MDLDAGAIVSRRMRFPSQPQQSRYFEVLCDRIGLQGRCETCFEDRCGRDATAAAPPDPSSSALASSPRWDPEGRRAAEGRGKALGCLSCNGPRCAVRDALSDMITPTPFAVRARVVRERRSGHGTARGPRPRRGALGGVRKLARQRCRHYQNLRQHLHPRWCSSSRSCSHSTLIAHS